MLLNCNGISLNVVLDLRRLKPFSTAVLFIYILVANLVTIHFREQYSDIVKVCTFFKHEKENQMNTDSFIILQT
jgi:hypothetical protein